MIEINLLPLELREKKKISFEQIFKGISFERAFKGKLVFAIFASLVLFHLLLHTIVVLNRKRLDGLKRRWDGLALKRKEIDQLKKESAEINKKIPLIDELVSNRVLWSKELNQISNLIVPGIWLNGLTVEREQAKVEPAEYLIIRGSAASRTKDEPALIGKFMQNLKDNSVFSADFAEIELGPIKNRQIAQTEVMDFTLICRFKPEKAKALLK